MFTQNPNMNLYKIWINAMFILCFEVLRGEESGPLTQLLVEYGARCDIVDDSGNSAETILQSLVTRYGNGPNMELSSSYQQLLQLFWESHGKKLKLVKAFLGCKQLVNLCYQIRCKSLVGKFFNVRSYLWSIFHVLILLASGLQFFEGFVQSHSVLQPIMTKILPCLRL